MNQINKKIERIAKKNLPAGEIDSTLRPFVLAVSDLLEEREQDCYIVERSMHCMTAELQEINKKLSDELFKNKITKQEAESSLVRLETLFNTVPEAMMSFYPGGAPRSINRSGLDIVGIDREHFLSNSSSENLNLWLAKIKEPDRFREELQTIIADNTLTLSGCLEMKDGRFFQYYGVPEFLDGAYIGRSWCWQDITEVMRHHEKLEYQVYHDSLTQLPNRESLFKSIDQELAKAAQSEGFVSIMFIDMDNFKNINDIAGHAIGDQFLVEVANRLKNSIAENEILGRLGGDEFLVVVAGVLGANEYDTRKNIKQAFKEPVSFGGQSFTLTCSVGISVYPYDGLSSNELIRKADMAMYQAKHAGKNAFHYFDEALEKAAIDRIKVENKLKQGIKNKEFSLVYQPKISLIDQNISGVEALIRWIDSDGNRMNPEEFIRIAENTGKIEKITKWVLQEAYHTIKKWQGTELEHLRMSVNISTLDLKNPLFSDYVLDLFGGEDLDISNLELELTESVLIDRCEATEANLQLLRQAGVKLSIDDFGTGYSNFIYLQALNPDYLKIDRSIVIDIDSNQKRAAIAQSIIDIGHNLGMEVIAEGVETLAENTYLRSIGCDYCQGYFYSKPLTQSDLVKYVKALRNEPVTP